SPALHPLSLHDALPISEESRTGTLELLLTAPVKDWAVVVGKFLGALMLYAVMIALTLFYPLLLILYKGNPDWGPIWSGYLGLLRSEEHTSELQSRVEIV